MNARDIDPNTSQGGVRYLRLVRYRLNSGGIRMSMNWLNYKHARDMSSNSDGRHISERYLFISGQNLLVFEDKYSITDISKFGGGRVCTKNIRTACVDCVCYAGEVYVVNTW